MKGPYDDIINRPYPVPGRRPRMTMAERAAQFSPFAALSGYGERVEEARREFDETEGENRIERQKEEIP